MNIKTKKYIAAISFIIFGNCFSAQSFSESTISINGDATKFKGGLSILKENKIELVGKDSLFIKLNDKRKVPDIEIYDQNSKNVKLNVLIKPKSAIHFWGTKCAPCLAEMEEFVKFAEKYETKYAQVIFISTDDEKTRDIANKKFETLTKGRFKSYYFKNVPQNDAFYGLFLPQTIFYSKNKRETTRGISAKNYAEDSEAIFKYLEKLQ